MLVAKFFISALFAFSVALAAPDGAQSTEAVGILERRGTQEPVAVLRLDVLNPGAQPPRVIEFDALRTKFPNCTDTCLNDWPGDGWCDTECANEDCGMDGGDCEGWCAADCPDKWIGDGSCDVDCFREECRWDGGDCDGNFTRESIKIPPPAHEDFDYAKCKCDKTLLHNKECNEECNNIDCNFDGLDCLHQCSADCANIWLGDGDCDQVCNTAKCAFDKGDCKICAPGCDPWMIGNGICDKACQNSDCHYDMGDCFEVCWVDEKMDYDAEPFFYPHCRDEWKGDGFCDCYCMNRDCDWDFGDCKDVDCTEEFKRLEELRKTMNVTGEPFEEPPAEYHGAGRGAASGSSTESPAESTTASAN